MNVKNINEFDNANILLVAGEQLRRVRDLLHCSKVTVITEPNLKWDYEDEIHFVERVVDYHNVNRLSSFVKFLKIIISTFKVLKKSKINLIISTGPAMAVPVCLVGKFMGAKVVHIESWSRINSISNSTKLILKLHLADVVVYQYKDNILAGRKKCQYWGHL